MENTEGKNPAENTVMINGKFGVTVTRSRFREGLSLHYMRTEYKNFKILIQFDLINKNWIVDVDNKVLDELGILWREDGPAFVVISNFIGMGENTKQLMEELQDAYDLSYFLSDLVKYADGKYKKITA